MKKLALLATVAMVALMFTSCDKTSYKSFVGTWGVEKIEYYNIDYAGNPIPASMETYTYDPNDIDDGIQLVFREDKSGEMRDNNVDTIWIENEETHEYDEYIYNPDTTLVYPFTYSYDKSDHILYMNMNYGTTLRTFRMYIHDFTDNSFVYENEYLMDYVEKAYMKRLSNTPTKSASRQAVKHPHKAGSFLGR